METQTFHFDNFHAVNDNPFGDDCITFNFDLVVEDLNEPVKFKAWLRMYDLLQFIRETQPELHQYISDTHGTIKGWGPKEGKLMDELDDAIDWEDWAYRFYRAKDRAALELTHYKKMMSITPEEGKKMLAAAADMAKHEKPMKQATNAYHLFCEAVDDVAQEKALEAYPEILEMDAKKLKEFRFMFVREIQGMYKRLERFLKE